MATVGWRPRESQRSKSLPNEPAQVALKQIDPGSFIQQIYQESNFSADSSQNRTCWDAPLGLSYYQGLSG